MNTRRSPALFATETLRAVELEAADTPDLQRFFEANPEYFLAVTGQGPTPTEADDEIHGSLPEGWPFTKKWMIGFVDATDSMVAMANVVSDVLAPGVWHIGLFIVGTPLQGSGAARMLYDHLERWARGLGAQWLRLGVVVGNARAERFWERCAFVEVRRRYGMAMGTRSNTIRVMAKPLDGGTLPDYLALVERDRPERRQHGQD